jgi:hypothetical protein
VSFDPNYHHLGKYNPGTPEEQMAQRVSRLVSECDELVVIANDPAQKHLIQPEWRALDQAATRLQLAASVFEADLPNKFRMIKNA